MCIYNIAIAQFGQQQVISTEADGVRYVTSGDIDGDGFIDVLSASSFDDKVAWYRNIGGTGQFGGLQVIRLMDQTTITATGDLDGDGDEDVVSIAGDLNFIAWFKNEDGNGSFLTIRTVSNSILRPSHIQIVDVDGDGALDIMASSGSQTDIFWCKNLDGIGTFSEPIIVSLQLNNGRRFIANDIDGDGDIDVAMTDAGDHSLTWVKNIDGLGTFGNPIPLDNNFFASSDVKAGDVDGDGDLDLVTVGSGGGDVAWYENLDGQGTFSDKIIISSGDSDCFRLELGDIDNDGDIDIVTSYLFTSELVLLYLNEDGLGTFGDAIVVTDEMEGTSTIHLADLDNDGDLDLLSSSQVDGKVAWYENLTILNVEEQNLETLSIYPNPAQDYITIKTAEQQQIKNVQCIDMQGRFLFRVNSNKEIDVSSLPSGIYLLKIVIEDGVVVRQFVKK